MAYFQEIAMIRVHITGYIDIRDVTEEYKGREFIWILCRITN